MLRQLRSPTDTPNEALTQLTRTAREDNLEWGSRAVADMGTGGSDAWSYIALVGGSDTMSFRLRVAQSHLRRDMLPSFWSDSVVLKLDGADLSRVTAIHVPLHQPASGVMATRTNGVVERPLQDFAAPALWPNIALIALPLPQDVLLEKIEVFRRSRAMLDALEHILKWLAFCWGVARTPNPLTDGVGIPSACMLETACAAASLDLTPGLESKASCPEAIWVAVRHWYRYFETFAGQPPLGRFCTPHKFPIKEDPGAPIARRR